MEKNIKYLTQDFMCPEIVDREDIRSDIKMYYTDVLIEEQDVPRAIFAYGGTGSGKTFVIKKTIEDNFDEIKRHIPTFDYVYINLKGEVTPSAFSTIFNINIQLEKYLPFKSQHFGWIEKIPTRSWSKAQHLFFLKEIIIAKKLCLTIIIDEVDRLVDFEKDSNFIHCFADLYQEFKDELFVGVCPVFISNKINLLKRLPLDTKSRIPHKFHFKPYGVGELFAILKTTAKYALDDNRYDDKLLLQVANKINDSTKSAREAKLLLHYMIIEENSERAQEKTDMDLVSEEIRTYSFHQKLALSAILRKHQVINKMQKSRNRQRYSRTDKLPNTKAIYDIYVNRCIKSEEKPKSFRQFHRLIEPMVRNGILCVERKGSGATRGMSNLLFLGEDFTTLQSILQQEMGGD